MSINYFDASYGRLITIEQEVLDERIRMIREMMDKNQIDLLLVAQPDEGGYRGWLTGTYKLDRFSEGGILIPWKGPVLLVTGSGVSQEEEQASEVIEHKVPYHYYETDRFDIAWIRRFLGERQRLGVVHMPQMRSGVYDKLLRQISGLRIVDITEQADLVKACKGKNEVRQMERLAGKADILFQQARFILRPGIYEREAVNKLRFCAYQLGCYGNDDGISARVRLVSGEGKDSDILYPRKLMKKGEKVNLEIYFAGDDSCYGALSRSYVLKEEPEEELRKLWTAALAAQYAAARLLRPGSTVGEATVGADRVLEKYGCRPDGGSLIAGIGYGMRERPKISDCSADWKLKENMVLFVEIFAERHGISGVCCGDMYVVHADGADRLNRFPQELILV